MFEFSKPYVQHFMQNKILEKAEVAEQDYILWFFKKLRLYSKLVSETVR